MMPGTPVSYDNNSLQTANIAVSDIQHEGMSTKLAIPYILAHANGSVIPFSEYSSKMITLQGTVTASSVAALDALLDTFRGFFAEDGKNLDIGYAGATRRYVAVPLTNDIQRPGGLNFANFTVTFMAIQAFGVDITSQVPISLSGLTASPHTDSFTVIGSAPAQLPIATITFHTITSTGPQTVSWGNNANGQQIEVKRNWVSNDVLQIDCVNKLVTVNGTPVDFAGAFIELPPGPQTTAYADSLTTRNFDINISYLPRWL